MKKLIIINKPGQLGNRLFVFSHFIAVAIEYKFQIINPSFDEYADYFEFFKDNNFIKYPVSGSYLKSIIKTKFVFYYYSFLYKITKRIKSPFHTVISIDWDEEIGLENLDYSLLKKTILFNGWLFRSNNLVKKHYEEIKKVFRISTNYQFLLDEYFKKIDRKNKLLIGVHIRRGDYQTFENGKYFFNNAIYLSYMHEIKQQSKKEIIFLICSNEEININDFNRDDVFSIKGPGHELMDLYAFSHCDYLIGPPSTFTMWASFYGNVPLYMIKDERNNDFSFQNFSSFYT